MQEVFAEFNKLIKKAMETPIKSPADPKRAFELHPSSFPYCGLRHLYEWKKFGNPKERVSDFRGDYYTSMGTTFHSVFQRNLGRFGSIVGNWVCNVPKCSGRRKFSANGKCPKCGAQMTYEELGIKWGKRIIGHTDGLFVIKKDGSYWVLDYKTTSAAKVDDHFKKNTPLVFPYAYNVSQIVSYCVLLEEIYEIKISGWFLIYASRDNPFGKRVLTGDKISTKEKAKIKLRLRRWDREFDLVHTARTFTEVKPILEKKPCKTYGQYKRTMHSGFDECPLSTGLCFGPKLEFVIKRLVERSRGRIEI